jgi:hypothetical protein
MKKMCVAVGLALLLSACGGAADSGATEEETKPGNAAVYERIAGLTDCAELQAEFDTASANNDAAEPGTDEHKATTAYMEAADARMQEVDCY